MRNAAFALCLSAALAAACASRSASRGNETEPLEPSTPEAGPAAAQGGGQAATGGDQLRSDWQQLNLQEQRKKFLVDQALETAKSQMQHQQLDAARDTLARALELDPDNLKLKEQLRQVGALQGDHLDTDQEVSQALQQEHDLKIQQLRADAEAKVRDAKVHIAREDYDRALTELGIAGDLLRWNPYNVSWDDLKKEIDDLHDDALAKRESAAKEKRTQAEATTLQSLRQQENAEENRKKAVIANLLNDAIGAFRAEQYDKAIDFAERAQRLDPRNERAADIRDTAFRQQRKMVRTDSLAKKLEQYKRWKEDMADLLVPNTSIVELPDEEFWNDITKKRAKRQGLDLASEVDPSTIELRKKLEETTIPGFKIESVDSLREVIDSLHLITNLPFVVHPAAEEAAVDQNATYNYDITNPLSAEKALNIITEDSGPDVTWTIRNEAILVTTKERARGQLVVYNHDVQDLIFGLTDFLGPRIDRLRLIDETTDEDGGGPFGGIGEHPQINDPEDLVTLIQENVEPASWSEDGVSITPEGGNIIVVQTAQVQQEVRQFLEDLRRFSSSLVTIESKFMTVTDAFIQEIGVEFRGLDNPGTPFTDLDDVGSNSTLGLDNNGSGSAVSPPSAGFFYDNGSKGDYKGRTEHIFGSDLGNLLSTVGGLTAQWTSLSDLNLSAILRLVEKSSNVELVNDQVISVHNTQRAYVSVINQRAYVQDFDVEVAQFQAVADPVINVLNEGIVLDVRPTINHNRRTITLEVQPTVARVVSLTDFTTTLAGQTAGVTFQLPELEVQSVFTTAVVPDGGSILLGGLSKVRNVERRAEVPWIANVPIVGFLFKEEGYNDEKTSLMIMIRAWITDVREELAKFEK